MTLRLSLFGLLFFASSLFASQDQVLAIRRITSCYRDHDLTLTKSLINDFLNKNKKSRYNERLLFLLGDIFQKENNYEKAIEYYSKVQSKTLLKQARLKSLNCEYILKDFKTLKKQSQKLLKSNEDLSKDEKYLVTFYYAESLLNSDLKNPKVLNQAAYSYEELLESSFASRAKLGLAQVYDRQTLFEKASNLYLECAHLFPNQKENYLFRAGVTQSKYNPSIACQTFYEILEIKGEKQSSATYNWMVLLLNTQNYQTLVDSQELIFEGIEPGKKVEVHFLLGKAYLSLKDYEKALFHLSVFLQDSNEALEKEEAYFLSILACYHLNKDEAFNELLFHFESVYSSSKFNPKIDYLKGKLFQKNQQWDLAKVEFKKILNASDSELAKSALFEYALCFYELGRWELSHDLFSTFLNTYSKSTYFENSLYFLLQSSLKSLALKPSNALKKQLLNDYHLALSVSFFEEENLPEIILKIGKLYLELSLIEDLQTFITPYLNSSFDAKFHYRANLLLAVSANEYHDEEAYLQKALLFASTLEEKKGNYLLLYRLHAKRAKELKGLNKVHSMELEKAACALYETSLIYPEIPKEHLLWLFYFTFNRKKYADPSEVKKILYLSKILLNESKNLSLCHQIKFDTAQFLGHSGLNNEKINSLESLIESLDPQELLYTKALFEVGRAHEELTQYAQAEHYYKSVLEGSSASCIELMNQTKLHLARLLIHQSDAKDLNHSDIQSLLKNLKAHISLKHEPLHLEAALDLAQYLGQNHLDALIKNLKQVQDFFSDTSTLCTQEYHEMRRSNPQKNELYLNYMQLIEARILRFEAKIAKQNKEKQVWGHKVKQAEKILNSLQSKSDTLTPYLIDQLQIEFNLVYNLDSSESSWKQYIGKGASL